MRWEVAVDALRGSNLLGLVLGSWASGVFGWFLWWSRSRRKARNRLVVHVGRLVIASSVLGTVILLLDVLERMGIARVAALTAYTLSLADYRWLDWGETVRALEIPWEAMRKPH